MKSINEIMLNPIRMRIIQELTSVESITAAELCEKISDVPRTTMYRHISMLIDHDILAVVSERRIRGSLERTIALNVPEITKHNTIENATQNAYGFLMCNYAKFHKYFSSENPDSGKDKLFLNNTILMTTDDEFDQFLLELTELLKKYTMKYSKGRKTRDISIISAPEEK